MARRKQVKWEITDAIISWKCPACGRVNENNYIYPIEEGRPAQCSYCGTEYALSQEDVSATLDTLKNRIAELEAENSRLRKELGRFIRGIRDTMGNDETESEV